MKKIKPSKFEESLKNTYMKHVIIGSIEEIDRSTWSKLKKELLDIHYELNENLEPLHTLVGCSKCGMAYDVLVEDIEKIFLPDECKNHQIYCKGRDENNIADWTCRLCNKPFFSKEIEEFVGDSDDAYRLLEKIKKNM